MSKSMLDSQSVEGDGDESIAPASQEYASSDDGDGSDSDIAPDAPYRPRDRATRGMFDGLR